jgi:glutathione synthase/RimK-type ligase-like ATP-grasp enzyme
MKPSKGSGGSGILVLKKNDKNFLDPSGEEYSINDLKRHSKRILNGEYSGLAERDIVIIEKRIFPSEKIVFERAAGLPDVRVFCVNNVPVMSMMRYSTKETKGRANLSAGAIGLAIDIETGKITKIHSKQKDVKLSLKNLGIPLEYTIPKWEEIKRVAVKASKLSGLKIIGVDVILDSNDDVMIIEINGRPGIEIQNINEKSLINGMFFLE